MLKVLQSNQLETLASHLGRELSHAPDSSVQLIADTIVVPNPGVARWLWLRLAQDNQVSANLDCVLPGSFVWRVFHSLLPDVPSRSPYDPAVMTWRLHRLLRTTIGDPAFADLLGWRDTTDDRRRFELAQRLARLFDQYIIYRPQWIEQWRKGDEQQLGWQQKLWRRLAAETAQPDWMDLRRQLEQLTADQVKSRLPQRINVFGIPLLSPGYLEVLTWLADHIDVNLFLPNPCREHWAHIIAARDIDRIAGVADEKTLYIETGNSLLASWGGQGRDLLDLIQNIEPSIGLTDFILPGNDTLLHAVQSQILELRDPGTDDQPAETVATDDRSIQIHVCHSPTRELEVLHDQLLHLLDSNRGLAASDVIVMTPDVDAYAPYIEAVFATPNRIPFHISDVNPRRGVALVETFLSLFDLIRDRFDANLVLAILETPAVSRQFGLSDNDLPQIREWARQTGVRWGLDQSNRVEFGRDDGGLHSWQHGLDRLLLGFALPGERSGTFAGVLPHDNVEGSAGLILASLAEFISRLKSLMSLPNKKRTATQWSQCLHQQLEAFFDIREEQEDEAQSLRDAINSLAQFSGFADNHEEIAIDLAIDWIVGQLDSNATMRGFLGHGVTFCGIVPMRNVPTPVVCLVGLNDGVFPRIEQPPGYDLIAAEPQRGDRSRRDDDRQAFLECLLNAREVFYLSYVGRGIRDDTPIPPSVLISEVIDYCNRSFVFADTVTDCTEVGTKLLTHHRVNAFSPRYFDNSDPRLFSYNDIMADPRVAADEPGDFVCGLEPADTALLAVSLEDLIRFYKNPTRALLRNRLDISYEGEFDPLQTSDPVVLEGLERWSTGELMLDLLDAGHSREDALTIVRNGRYTPIGRVADVALSTLMGQMQQTREALELFRPDTTPTQLNFTLRDAGVTLTGRLDNLYASGQFLWRHGKTKADSRLNLWIRHLVLNIEKPEGIACSTYWRADDGELSFAPLPDAQTHLRLLLQLYRRGMSEALPFFTESAWLYIEHLGKNNDSSAALAAAKKKYSEVSPFYKFNEESDPYRNRVFRHGVDWNQFADLATAIFAPLKEHLH